MFAYTAKVTKVVDGDTVDLEVDLGFHVHIDIRTRLYGINAPERYATGGPEATAYLKTLLPISSPVTLRTFKDPTDKYGRWLAIIVPENFTLGVSDMMLAAGHAVVYKG